ncbi:MAG: CDP-alcohol phosphatidyltransferase family protein [Pseudomonadota bacterium]|nr:CDP-alcohol phosphatidyltransferase family protein [Pseudomonadota bacterium]
MKSSLPCDAALDRAVKTAAPGRPREIEEATNLYLVHPVSRALVDRLIRTPVTPNQVSVASVFMAAAGALCYVGVAWPLGALAGLAFFFAWHVLDGADGDLARRSGRASTSGELVDGICDHVSQAMLYVALAVILSRSLGGWAWAIALAAAACHFVQANAYETGRKTYRRWVYGAGWMRQNPDSLAQTGALRNLLGGAYLWVSNVANPGEGEIESAMATRLAVDGASADAARARYRELYAPLVKASAVLGGNVRTLTAFLAVLAGAPLWFFAFEIVILNLALAGLVVWRRRLDRALLGGLAEAQAASAPN